MDEEKRYLTYSDYLKSKYGEKVYKLPVNLPGTCPNRDNFIGSSGCIFCDEEGSGFDLLPNSLAIKEQIEKNKKFFSQRFKAKKFIVYYQAFTNTYWPLDKFKSFVEVSGEVEDVVEVSVSTRPDCISDNYLDVLKSLSENKNLDINIELGLQTINYHTLEKINRGHTLAEFVDAVKRNKKRGFATCVHLIINLPWDNMNDVVECAKLMSALEVEQVKLHSLYIVEGTVLGEMYKNNEFEVISLDEYVERVINFIEHLSSDIVIQRLVGKGPKNKLLFNNWDRSWWHIKERIEKTLQERNTWQGKKCNYLNGRALNKFQ
ncbi:TIGR01212 family radical SAM protein [Natranaerofaba carboxydovora]|uniref:TIGR01212 family radical SAM protein n=1 Tax=Natranaerofaba carboxydovora TaxID=2742683 RepID=UPI001F12D223|nr:TIGR01212 family radical SAM protein [Natranaerofaba carboxydovora]UMZ73811.1 Oxygen-independent coproporphyrinogen-III oxidase-like protein [Natranaerofaba carboxydovora]